MSKSVLYPCLGLVLVTLLSVSCGNGSQPEVRQESVQQPETNRAPAPAVKPGEITSVDLERVFSLMQTDGLLLIDCRPPIFYHLGHIDGAVSLPLKRFARVIGEHRQTLDQAVSAGKVIVLYCQNLACPDAYIMAKKLSPLGYSVSVYKGGWEEWKTAGL